MKAQELTINPEEVVWSLHPLPEITDPYGEWGPYMRKSDITKMLKRAESNPWEWCLVELEGRYRGILTSSDFLGNCSYKSAQDFQTNSGYYEDMKATVLDSLNSQLQTLIQ